MTAAVLSTGTELTRGELTNTNATWLSEQLTTLGFEVELHLTVGDDVERIASAMRTLAGKVDVVVCTGGLGPTTDDLSALAAAKAIGVPLVRDEPSLDRIKQRFAKLGRPMNEANEKQADLPESAIVLPNGTGTAPGFSVTLEKTRFFFMPGVPSEMRQMFGDAVVPLIARLATRTTHQIHLRTIGLPESEVQMRLGDVEAQFPGITVGYRAHFPEVEVKVHARATTEQAAEALARVAADLVRVRLGDAVYGDREDTFAAAVGRALRNRGLTIAVAESITGGLVGAMLTSVPGSSDYLLFDAVTYANSAKTEVLGVSPEILRGYGSVSPEVATAMAKGALRVSGAHLAIAITGVAGPEGGTDQTPVGTVYFSLVHRDGTSESKQKLFPGDRERIRTLAAYQAMRMLHRAARGLAPDPA